MVSGSDTDADDVVSFEFACKDVVLEDARCLGYGYGLESYDMCGRS